MKVFVVYIHPTDQTQPPLAFQRATVIVPRNQVHYIATRVEWDSVGARLMIRVGLNVAAQASTERSWEISVIREELHYPDGLYTPEEVLRPTVATILRAVRNFEEEMIKHMSSFSAEGVHRLPSSLDQLVAEYSYLPEDENDVVIFDEKEG